MEGRLLDFSSNDDSSHVLTIDVTHAGHYDLNGCHININKKPCLLHRLMVKALLGWGWTDNKGNVGL